MSPEEVAAVRATLLRLREELRALGAVEVRVEADEVVASAADEDDAPHKEMGQSIASARNRERAERDARIEDALRRLAADPESFGLCRTCEEPIDPRRLALLPFVDRCVGCAAEDGGRGPATRRKITDYR